MKAIPQHFIIFVFVVLISIAALVSNTVANYSIGYNILKTHVLNIITYNFVHVNFLHLIANCMGIWYAYTELVRIRKKRAFIFLFIIIGVLAGGGSALLNPATHLTAGCSGSILGIIMFSTVYELITSHGTIYFSNQLFTWCGVWLTTIIFEILMPLNIDHYIHLCGAVIGGLLGWLSYFIDNYDNGYQITEYQ